MGASSDTDQVSLHSWTPGSTITIDVGGVTRMVAVDANGFANIQRPTHGQDIVHGMTITAGDGTRTKTLVVADIRITSVALADDIVSGVAPANTNVHVNVHQNFGPPVAQADVVSDGAWSVDFTAQVDLRLGMNIHASVGDDDGDFSAANRFLPLPTVGAGIDFDGVFLNNWTPGSMISLDIGGAMRTATVDGNGNAQVQRSTHGQDIAPGMVITATDGTTTKTLTVAGLSIVTVAVATDVVSGTAPANTSVQVNVNAPTPGPPLAQVTTTSDAGGNWSVDFTSQVDLQLGMSVGANVSDVDGDNTLSSRFLPRPTVGAGITGDSVFLNGWTPGSTVTVTIGSVTRTVVVDGNGNGNLQPSTHGQDIVAGMTITAADGTTTKTLVVANFDITTLDIDTDLVSGIAPGNTSVNVNVNNPGPAPGPPLAQATATSDAAGNWSVDFTAQVDIQSGMSVSANVFDTDGDTTSAFRTAAAPPPTPIARPPGAIVIGHVTPESLDPGVAYHAPSWEILDQMFRGLTRYDDRTGELELELAESYTASADLRTWTFTLREALWSDGEEITAEDVAFAIERSKDPATNGNPSLRLLLEPIEEAVALDPTTVEIRLTEPLGYVPALMSLPATRPVPQHAIEVHGAAWLEPENIVVSGAYTLASRSPAAVVLERNPKYDGEATIETVVYDTTAQSAFAERYLAGELDFVPAGLLGLGPNPDVQADPRFAADLVIGAAPGTQYLVFNAAHGPTVNVDVRRALSAATDRVRIASEVIGDASLAATTLTSPNVFGAVPPSAGIGITYDEDAARAYQAAAGPAFPSSITLRSYNPANQARARMVAIIEADWERIFGPGFTVNVEVGQPQQVFDQLSNPDPSVQAPVTMVGWLIDWPDASNFMDNAVRATQTRWTNAAYDTLVARAAATLDPAARAADYADAERILTETEAALAPLHTLPDAFVRKPDLSVVGDRIENWRVGAEARVDDVATGLEEIVQSNPGTPLADKVEDALTKVESALAELEKSPPDRQAALGDLEGALGDLEAAHQQGLIDATDVMDELAGIARQIAAEAIDEAETRSGNPGTIAEARQRLAEGDALRADERFKDAVAKYRDALAKAESA